MKSDKMPCIIYADIESLIRKIDGFANNPENSSTTNIGEQFGYFITQKSNILYIVGKIVWKSFFSLSEHVKKLTHFFKKMLPLIKEELKLHQDAKLL